MTKRNFENLSLEEINELIYCVGAKVMELKNEFKSDLRNSLYDELYNELTLRISVEAQREEIQLVATYIDLKSVGCVVNDTSLDVHPIDLNGHILNKKFNLLENPDSEWMDNLNDYDYGIVNKLLEEA